MRLEARELLAGYDSVPVLHGISLTVESGEIVAIVGRNGVGKTTLVKALMGVLPVTGGRIVLDDKDVTRRPPSHRVRAGMRATYQERALFQELLVGDNLRLNGFAPSMHQKVLGLFPDSLVGRESQRAGTLSGGEQKMLAAACALVSRAPLIVMDEPSEGLQPSNVDLLGQHIDDARSMGSGVLLIEQHLALAERLADRFIVLEKGEIVDEGSADEDRIHDRIAKRLVI